MHETIREARASDIKEIVPALGGTYNYFRGLAATRHRSLQEFPVSIKSIKSTMKDSISKQIRSPNGLVLVAEANNRIVGYSASTITKGTPLYNYKKMGLIEDVYVIREYRNMGVDARLVNETIKWFRKKKVVYMSVNIRESDKSGHNIYESLGFEDYGISMRQRI